MVSVTVVVVMVAPPLALVLGVIIVVWALFLLGCPPRRLPPRVLTLLVLLRHDCVGKASGNKRWRSGGVGAAAALFDSLRVRKCASGHRR